MEAKARYNPPFAFKVQNALSPVVTILGSIELNNISFRYTDNGPWIIDHLNLKIPRGQYLAIVGTTGCGKTTLMRLMMGFETPKSGAVYYDGKDIQKLDQKSLRQQIGVVMQNGKLCSGDIFSNITISAPQLGLKEPGRLQRWLV